MRTPFAKTSLGLATALALAAAVGAPSPAKACGLDPIIGDICLVSFGFCPNPYLRAAGQVLWINDYQALHSLLGATYGGDGTSTFGVPDLRSRVPLSVGQRPGQPSYALGQTGGAVTVTPTVANLPLHTHDLSHVPITARAALGGIGGDPNVATPGFLAQPRSPIYRPMGTSPPQSIVALNSEAGTMTATVSGQTVSTGDGVARENRPPYLSMVYCIAYDGTYPSRP